MSPLLPTADGALSRAPMRLALWLLLAMWFMGTWLGEPYLMGRGQDWAYFVHHTTVASRTWTEYGQVPFWNPWFCGGIPALANIQTDALAPDLLLTLPFDVPVALALRTFLFFVLGLEGTWHYARHHGVRGFGGVVAAAAFAFSGRFMMVLWDGHLPFMTFALAPWALWGLERSYERPRWALLSALAVAWVFMNGGAVATPILVVTMGLVAVRDAVERLVAPTAEAPRARWHRPLVSLASIGLLAALVTLPRLVPVMRTLVEHPRAWDESERLSVFHVSGMLFLPPRSWQYFDIGTSYVGLGVGLAFVFALALRLRPVVKLAIAGALAFDLAMGEAGPLQLWRIMHALPVVENVRAAFRFTFIVGLFVAIGAGRFVTWIEARLAERGARARDRLADHRRWRDRPRALSALLVGSTVALSGAAAFAIGHHGPIRTRQRLTEIPRLEVGPIARGDFRQAIGTRWIAHVWPRANLGSLACFEEQPFPTSPLLRADRVQEEWLARGEGRVTRRGWSPNELELEVETEGGGLVAVNQNADRGWTSDVGDIVAHHGLLAVEVPPGRHLVTLTYREASFLPCTIISVATLLLGLGWVATARTRGWRRRPLG